MNEDDVMRLVRARADDAADGLPPERCTECMVGQGDNCHCSEPVDSRALRWLLVAVVAFWGGVAWLVKWCAT